MSNPGLPPESTGGGLPDDVGAGAVEPEEVEGGIRTQDAPPAPGGTADPNLPGSVTDAPGRTPDVTPDGGI